jgi:SAM-dependent methyltransferase
MDPIISEHPADCWSAVCIHAPDARILDLGCGFGKPGSDCDVNGWSTSLTFAAYGASLVVGVDRSRGDLDRLTDTATRDRCFNRIVYLPIDVGCVMDVHALLWYVRPDVIKCDIEGAERYLFEVTLPPETRLVSIKCYHTQLEAQCLLWLSDQLFEVFANQSTAAVPITKVITGKRRDIAMIESR